MNCRLLPLLALLAACAHAPPVAPVHDHVTTLHGENRNDSYAWLRNRASAETLDYLRAENRYFERRFSPLQETRARILTEMKSRLDENESTAPAKDGPFLYYSRYVAGADFELICRRPSAGGPEEILLDPNERARGKAYYQNRGWAMSDDHRYLAFAEDVVGRRFYTIRFKDTRTGQLLADAITDVTPNFVWENDGKTLLYVKQDPVTLRWERVFRHVLGQPPGQKDQELYREADETFEVSLTKALNRKAVFLGIESTLTRDVRILDPGKPGSSFTVFAPRVKGHEYWLAHGGDRFFILTNDHAKNFRLKEAPLDRTGRKHWKEVIAHRRDAYIDSFLILRDHVALIVLKDGLPRIELRDRTSMGKPRLVQFDDPAYAASFGENLEYETRVLRLQYESLRIPESAYDVDLATGARTLVQRKRVLGGFDPERYVSRRLFVQARDGARVPVSLIHGKDLRRDGKNPLLVDGYGAYGSSSDPEFSSNLVSLYDRGFVYAIAHVRGGSELGRPWYEDGRQRKKMNSFTDLIDVSAALQREGYSSPAHTYLWGVSAGGLLVGATMNLRPDLFNGVIAQVPFVDVINTMLDATIPLTTAEYDEWGDPRKKADYEYIRQYSPYDNVRKTRYPHLLVTAGLHDSQVQYWEPAKWVARIRKENPESDRLVLLKTDLEAGHGGKAGRFQRLELTADILSFLVGLEQGLLKP